MPEDKQPPDSRAAETRAAESRAPEAPAFPDARRYVVTALAEERPDLLSQTVSLLRRRAFRNVSVSVGRTERDHVARLTFAVGSSRQEADRLVRELGRMLYVIEARNLCDEPTVVRDLLLVKVAAEATDRAQVAQVCEVFRARIVDVAPESVIVEATGSAEKLDGLLAVLRPFGILEMSRNGPVALGRADQVLGKDMPTSSWLERRLAMHPAH